MSETQKIGTGTLQPMIQKTEHVGNLDGKKVVRRQKPLFVALMILGIIGLGAAGIGFGSLGAHQGWWSAGGLSNLSQINAIVVMSAGGGVGMLLLVIGIVGLVKANHKKEHLINESLQDSINESLKDKVNLTELDRLLEDKTWTFARQENGQYSLVVKHAPRQGATKGEIEEITNDIPYDNLSQAPSLQSLGKLSYTYVKTSPTDPTDILISLNTLSTLLKPPSYTFVLQVNGNYSLVARHFADNADNSLTQVMKTEIAPKDLNNERKEPEQNKYVFILTSSLPEV